MSQLPPVIEAQLLKKSWASGQLDLLNEKDATMALAAPEMHDALVRAVFELKVNSFAWEDVLNKQKMKDTISICEAAIARARGEK